MTLTQVSDMAENGADRTKRVAACEFLHAITLWMIGETLTTSSLLALACSTTADCWFCHSYMSFAHLEHTARCWSARRPGM